MDEKTTGFITAVQLKKAMVQSNQLTPKEINVLLRNIKEDAFEYGKFDVMLYDVRFELAKSRVMDTNIDKLQEHLVEMFQIVDVEHSGKITIQQAQEVLLISKKVNLTPFQIQILIGLSAPDEKGRIRYKEFSHKCKDMIEELFSMKSMSEKATLIKQGTFTAPDNLEEIKLTKLEMFNVSALFLLNMRVALQEIR